MERQGRSLGRGIGKPAEFVDLGGGHRLVQREGRRVQGGPGEGPLDGIIHKRIAGQGGGRHHGGGQQGKNGLGRHRDLQRKDEGRNSPQRASER
jgi:hypothetical protein